MTAGVTPPAAGAPCDRNGPATLRALAHAPISSAFPPPRPLPHRRPVSGPGASAARPAPRRGGRGPPPAPPRRPAAAPPAPPPARSAPRGGPIPPPRLPESPPPDGPGGNPAPVRPSPAVSAIPRAYKSSFHFPRPPSPHCGEGTGVRTPLLPTGDGARG